MKTIYRSSILAAVLVLVATTACAGGDYYKYKDVMTIQNSQSTDSMQITEYFAEDRGIPPDRICTINTLPVETISRATFNSDIIEQVRACIDSISTPINYMVTTKGVPLRILNDGSFNHAAVDSELMLIGGHYEIRIGKIGNGPLIIEADGSFNLNSPYFGKDTRFSFAEFDIRLVTRLTAYTVADVIALIDRAEDAEEEGTFVIDMDPTRANFVFGNPANRQLLAADIVSTYEDQTVFLDNTLLFITEADDVLGYSSWGSNDANYLEGNLNFLPGAVAHTYVSTSARTFTPNAIYGQSLIADLIKQGVSGVSGSVYEPGVGAITRPNILFDRMLKCYVLADAFYMSLLQLSYQTIVIGDPKMKWCD